MSRNCLALVAGLIYLCMPLPAFSASPPEIGLDKAVLLHARKVFQERTIDDPEKHPPTRSPAGRAVYRKTVDAVVLVVTQAGALGSGVVFHRDGWIVTNWHVVRDAPVVGVIFRQERFLSGGKLLEQDVVPAYVDHRDSTRDLALLRLARRPVPLVVVPFADMRQIEVGEDVYAIGHPKGLLWTYTQGVISQIRPNYSWRTTGGTEHRATVIQTQTMVAPGSSGGPLFDPSGQLAGIIAVGHLDTPGLNFAVAANELTDFIRELTSTPRR